jgi:hypothetical protein
MATKTKKKWKHYRGKLPQYIDEKYVDRIDVISAKREELANKTNEELQIMFRDKKYEKDQLEADLAIINLELEVFQMLVPRFEASSVQSSRLNTGELFYLKDEPHVKVVNKEENNNWAIQNGLDELRTIPWQTLNSLTKQRMENGESTPKGIEIYLKTQVVMRKS